MGEEYRVEADTEYWLSGAFTIDRYRARAMAELASYEPANERERILRERLIIDLQVLDNRDSYAIYSLLRDITLILDGERGISDEFRKLLRRIAPSRKELDDILGELA